MYYLSRNQQLLLSRYEVGILFRDKEEMEEIKKGGIKLR